MKKCILINSPIFWDAAAEGENYLSPLGLGYIATYVEKAGIQVEILDAVKQRKSVEDIVKYIEEKQPDYVGINIFTQNYKLVKDICEQTKVKCEWFIGGPVVGSIYEEIVKWNLKNRMNIIIGDGEYIIPTIILDNKKVEPIKKNENIKVFRVDAESEFFPRDISDIVLNRKFFHDEIIKNHYGEREIAMVTSRGCIYNCAFCGGARSVNRGIPVRIRSEQSIVNEINDILKMYPEVKSIRVLDDLFLSNKQRIKQAIHVFSEYPQLSWRGMAHVLSLKPNLDDIEKLKGANCRELFMGIESGSESMRKKINKVGSTGDVIEVAQKILQEGIDLKGYFIYGFPQETEYDFQQTYELARKISNISQTTEGNFRTSVFQFRPYHGTKLYNDIVSEKGIVHECEFNDIISKFKGRNQFNFDFGNYSEVSDEILNQYIIKTQEIGEGNA